MGFSKYLLLAVLCTGCIDELLAPRARNDLGCDDIQVTATYAGEYEATGCGGTVDYACVPSGAHSLDGPTCIREGNVDTAAPVIVVAPAAKPPTKSADPGFPVAAAVSSMKLAASFATDCNVVAGPRGSGTANVTFEKDGHVSSVALSEPFQGTPVGECVADKFRRVTVPTFTNGPKVTKKSFDVPEPPLATPSS